MDKLAQLEKELLADMEENPVEYRETVNNVFEIDSNLRTINIPITVKNIGVEADDDVKRLEFTMPKQYGELDLSQFRIRINYMNANGDKDIYLVEDKKVSGDKITFSWLVGRDVVKYKGQVNFIVCLKLSDEKGRILKELNTTLCRLEVLEGLEVVPVIDQKTTDLIEQLLRMVETETTGTVKKVTEEGVKQIAEVQKAAQEIIADREQIQRLCDEAGNYTFNTIDGVFIDSYGAEQESNGYSCTDFIKIASKVKILTYVGNDNSRHAFYDSNKKLISSENDFDKRVLTELKVPENARYLRVSTFTNQKKKLVITINDITSILIERQNEFDSLSNDLSISSRIAKENKYIIDSNGYTEYEFKILDGKFINNDGNEQSEVAYSCTDFVKITRGIRLLCHVGNDNSRYAFYDEEKKIISSKNSYEHNDVLTEIPVPNNAVYFRASVYKSKKDDMKILTNSLLDDTNELRKNIYAIKSNNYAFKNIKYINGIYITNYKGQEGNYASDIYSGATDYVEVMPNSILKMSKLFLTSNRTVAVYDKDRKPIKALTNIATDNSELIVKIDDNVRYVRATGKKDVSPEFEYLSIITKKDFENFVGTNGYTTLYQNATLKPTISFIDDDTAGKEVVQKLKEFCDTINIKISFAGLTSNIGQRNYQDSFIQQMLQYEREGFPTIVHGYTQGIFYRKADRNIKQAEEDLVHGLQDFHKWGFTDYKACWVTPFGEYDEELKSLAYKWGFESLIRYTKQEEIENPYKLTPNHRYELYRYTFESEKDLPKMKKLVDEAVACNGWVLFGVHSSYPTCQTPEFYQAFTEIVNYMRNKGGEVRTINEELRRRMSIYNNYEKY